MSARHTLTSTPVYKSVDARRLSVSAALTYPIKDKAGDFVHPAGIDWTLHKSDPRVGYEHLRIGHDGSILAPGERGFKASLPMVTVGRAADQSGNYSVALKSLNVDGKRVSIPVGTTYFDSSDKLSSQVFKLIEEDSLPGVSIEFTLRPGCFKAIGRSPLENRSAYEISACDGLGYVHCKVPVNDGALIAKSVPDHISRLIRYARTGKLGSEALHPVLMKSFSSLASGKPSSVVGGFKAMDTGMGDMGLETAYEAPMEETTDLEPEGPPTAKLCYELAQAIKDISDHGRSGVKSSEHIPAKKKTLAGLDKLDGMASFFLSLAQKIEADVGDEVEDIDLYEDEEQAPEETEAPPPAEDATPVADEGADEPEEPEDDSDDEKKPFKGKSIDRRANGILKAIPENYTIRRFSLKEIQSAPVVKSTPEPGVDFNDPASIDNWLGWAKVNDPVGHKKVIRAIPRW